MNPPDDLIELGRISGAYGLRGWVTVIPASENPEVLLKCKQWWLSEIEKDPESQGPAGKVAGKKKAPVLRYNSFDVIQVKPHSGKLVAHLMGVEDRTLAENFKGRRVYVSRARFPAPAKGEFYWIDLEGCQVVNEQGIQFGQVDRVVDHGAHPILEVGQHLIPFVESYVLDVDVTQRKIVVDWQEDY